MGWVFPAYSRQLEYGIAESREGGCLCFALTEHDYVSLTKGQKGCCSGGRKRLCVARLKSVHRTSEISHVTLAL